MRLRFGDCVFDGDTRELSRGGALVHLAPKVFGLLQILLDERPAAVSKEKLTERLWPGIFVGDGNLARLAAEMREAIGDDAHAPRFVRTVARFGYAFHGEVVEEGPPPRSAAQGAAQCTLVWGEREIPLAEGGNVIGRDAAADVALDDASVSRQHARIVIAGSSARVEDLGSKNGTFVRERKLDTSSPLRDGDSIRLGMIVVVFRRLAAGAPTVTASTG